MSPKREVAKLHDAPGTRSVEVVSCQEEGTCNLQVMFDNGFRVSMPILNGDTKDILSNRMFGLIEQYRPASGSQYSRLVRMLTKALGESMCDVDGKVEIIATRVAALVPRWEVNLFWDFLEDLKIPIEYEDAIEVVRELGFSTPLAESEVISPPI
jgi:hypothetical protein